MRTVSGSISPSYSEYFSPFLHSTGSLSVSQEYLALPDGAGKFKRGVSDPALLRIPPPGLTYAYGAITLYRLASQPVQLRASVDYVVLLPPPGRNRLGLGYCAFARHYLRNHYCFLLLQVLRCFSSLGSPPSCDGYPTFSRVGCPIRKSPDHVLCADPRSLSQLITSFIASESLGIPHTPLITSFNDCPTGTTACAKVPNQTFNRMS